MKIIHPVAKTAFASGKSSSCKLQERLLQRARIVHASEICALPPRESAFLGIPSNHPNLSIYYGLDGLDNNAYREVRLDWNNSEIISHFPLCILDKSLTLQAELSISHIPMNQDERVKYWLEIVADDLNTAEYLFAGARWLYTAFMCHQVIEKVLKAYWTAIHDDDPPYTHSHAKLLDGCGLKEELNDEQLRFIAMMVPMNIEARYPQYKNEIANKLNKETCKYILEQTKQLHTWILQKL